MSDETVHGWDAIASVLGIEVRAAQDRAKRNLDPLPVRVNHKGPWAYVSALRDWVHRSDMAYSVSLRMKVAAHQRASTSNDSEKSQKAG